MPFVKGHPGGPGRPKKTDKHAGAIAKAEKRIADRLPMLIDKALDLADGVLVEDVNPVLGTKSVYKKEPDLGAIKYLIDRVMGKPTERNDVTISTDNWIFDPTATDAPPADDAAE